MLLPLESVRLARKQVFRAWRQHLWRAPCHHVDLEAEVPAELHTAVAEVMAWAYRLKHVAQQRRGAPTPIIYRYPGNG